jgi:putative MATE family efflux protein
VGQGLGPASLAGVATGGFIVWIVLAAASLPAVGLTAVASRRHGEGRRSAAAEAGYQALWLGLALALLIAVTGLSGLRGAFALMDTPPDVTAEGSGYLTVYLAGVPIVFSYFVLEAAFRASGDTRTPLLILLLSVGLNFVLDPLLIFGPGPVPEMGVEGVAAATLVTRAIGCAVGYPLLVRRGLIARAPLSRAQIATIFRIGAPLAAGGVVFSFIYLVLTRITAPFGTEALAALGVGHRIEAISYTLSLGFGAAAATAIGQNLGAGKPDRAKASGRVATRYALYFTLFAGAILLLAPQELMRMFTQDPGVVSLGARYLMIVAIAQPFMALELVLESGMGGAGYTTRPTVASITLTGLRIPLAYWLAAALGVTGIWWTISLTGVARGLAMSLFWRAGRWRHARA